MQTLTPEKFNLKLPKAELRYFPNFFSKKEADILFQKLRTVEQEIFFVILGLQ